VHGEHMIQERVQTLCSSRERIYPKAAYRCEGKMSGSTSAVVVASACSATTRKSTQQCVSLFMFFHPGTRSSRYAATTVSINRLVKLSGFKFMQGLASSPPPSYRLYYNNLQQHAETDQYCELRRAFASELSKFSMAVDLLALWACSRISFWWKRPIGVLLC